MTNTSPQRHRPTLITPSCSSTFPQDISAAILSAANHIPKSIAVGSAPRTTGGAATAAATPTTSTSTGLLEVPMPPPPPPPSPVETRALWGR
ncbi:uncharacterized protein BP01DRAFT_354287 [Aspergillus saccharolyticus JOP 1030-1]|uniref:Uncharacterized protein n=1 Tax=Aspergillus saccharolyticus JOP 1030-1 TaxID=1450539 RepID=A0A319A716_9EURO|nr:hypothetical protein BP01DRAFT_354287 [Aspergillus saccharolyticus JOP 1030-1]PYH47758.1 hypothetical protein BP01DRAFT_354287 [Aspergillus saccharolyticus JOP 1030-1]